MNRLLAASCALWVFAAHAYPIRPRTLWNLASEAEAIVIATVVEFHDAPAQPTSFAQAATERTGGGDDFARLRVTETLKGSPLTELDVVTNSGFLCPAPPRFVAGKTLVAFLSSDGGRWHVTALSYGTLYPTAEELPLFRSLLTRAVNLQATAFTEGQRMDWALEAASRRATRWHGAYELLSELDRRHARYDKRRPQAKLSKDQQRAIAKGFIAEPSGDRSTPAIISLLDGFDTPGLEPALVGAIDTLVETDRVTARDAMGAFVTRKKGDVEALLGDNERSAYELAAVRSAWDRVRAKYSLPEGVKVPRREQPRGAGEETPL